ncbi:sigma-70 family RNA polymerase sigma factor [Nocardia farcinica]|uniref:Sigma-K factor n=2 Tax=Nocardia farcinica TaxID=37329 RepID=A0A449GDS8_NOCFR|nr:sigma-70 family RNA polymerase sigma factor [Nocardia farcinica]MBF6069830.1 sigma-70 family RNA polymerase sigma factor [Nocardia farcinica]MBF6234648.1 sigma-70 family RNA polymerase sigma factor [Nocardia farcinica]MBF6518698.1 sigma-70 family RNA polymerase sigma factor [Nocardia farcinica]VFA90853.1 Sigma-K factor [Nocardia farcinica]BAD57869.1 putative sigma factor [Nocardia farcinica IFM 10152]
MTDESGTALGAVAERVGDAEDAERQELFGAAAVNGELAALLARIAAGDRAAFTAFYRATHARVFGIALRTLRVHPAAEETAQEVYLQVWSSAASYDRRLGTPLGWLLMLTHRRAIDRIRADAAAGNRERTYGTTFLERDYDQVSDVVLRRLEGQEVARWVQTLTPIQRQAICLAYYGDRSYPQVAADLGVPLPTVKTRIRSGLKRLESCLRPLPAPANPLPPLRRRPRA